MNIIDNTGHEDEYNEFKESIDAVEVKSHHSVRCSIVPVKERCSLVSIRVAI